MYTIPHFDIDKGCDPYLIIENRDGKVLMSTKVKIYKIILIEKNQNDVKHFTPNQDKFCTIKVDSNIELQGDLKFRLFDYDLLKRDVCILKNLLSFFIRNQWDIFG